MLRLLALVLVEVSRGCKSYNDLVHRLLLPAAQSYLASCRICLQQGAYYYWDDVRLGQGRDKALQYLRDNPEQLTKLEAMCRERLQTRGAARDSKTTSRASLSQEVSMVWYLAGHDA